MKTRWIEILTHKKTILGFFVLIIVSLSVTFWLLERKVTSQTLERLSDQFSLALGNQLDKERSTALQYALILSRNNELRNALVEDDEDKGFEILSEVMETIKLHTDVLIRSQIITSDYVIFARSWDNSYAGMPLDFLRPDLLYFQNHKQPRSAIEVGRKLGVKATVPVYIQNELIGFVEAVTFFETTEEYFNQLGIKMYILMDDQFLNTAVFMQDNPSIGKDYVLANTNYTQSDLSLLSDVDFQALKNVRVVNHKDHYLFYEPMKNGEGEVIGAFVFSLTKKQVSTYAHSDEEDLSFLINFSHNELYEIMAKKSQEHKVYDSAYDKELIYLKDVVAPEDKELFLQEARERLNTYSKDELIGIILGYQINKEIKGTIK